MYALLNSSIFCNPWFTCWPCLILITQMFSFSWFTYTKVPNYTQHRKSPGFHVTPACSSRKCKQTWTYSCAHHFSVLFPIETHMSGYQLLFSSQKNTSRGWSVWYKDLNIFVWLSTSLLITEHLAWVVCVIVECSVLSVGSSWFSGAAASFGFSQHPVFHVSTGCALYFYYKQIHVSC